MFFVGTRLFFHRMILFSCLGEWRTLSPAESFCQFFNIFTFPLFFRQGGLFIFHLVQCMTEEMTIEDAHKLISEDYFFTGLIIVISES